MAYYMLSVTCFLVAYFISFSLQDDQVSTSLLLEFNQRSIVLNELDDKFSMFVSSPSNDEELRKDLEMDFLHSFTKDFKKTDEWLISSMTTNDLDKNLLRAELSRNENHVSLTKAFFLRINKAFESAIMMHKRANMLMETNLTDVLELEKQGQRGLDAVESETEAYLTQVAWKEQYKKDVKKFLQKWQFLANVEEKLVENLKQKYSFRTWLVISRPRTTKQWITCSQKHLETFEMALPGEKMMLLLSVASDQAFNSNSAGSLLKRIQPDSAHVLCRSRAQDIFNEMDVSCSKMAHAFVATVGWSDDRSLPVIAASDPRKFRSTKSLRTWWIFCRRYYETVIFG